MKFKKILIFLFLMSFSLLNANTRTYYGKIDNLYPITMELTFNNDKSISGYYFYNKWKKKIKFTGKYDQNTFSLNTDSEAFTGIFSDEKILGKWKNSSSSMNFHGYSTKNINPFEDNKLTCDELKAYPEEIFDNRYGVDLGSGHGSPLDVDYGCEGSLETLNFTKTIYSLATKIRSEHSNRCSGSIIHAHWRYYHFDLLKAGLAPDLYTKYSIQNDESSSSDVYRMYENQKKYFSVWGHMSLYNYELYKEFWSEYNKAYPLLTEHFEKTFSVTNKQAKEYAEYALREFVLYAAGSFTYYQDGRPDLVSIEKTVINPSTTLDILKNRLKQSLSQTELDQGLKVAILYNRDFSFIESLLENGASINNGDESALFFALKNKKMIKFLLEKGADVNYRNSFGKTILYYAIELDDIDTVKILVENGANLNNAYIDAETRDKLEWSGKIPIYQSLCSLEHTKRTPLMHASQHASVDMLKFLISHGAKKDVTDEINYNVLDYAHMEKKEKNIAYLESIGLTTKQTYWR